MYKYLKIRSLIMAPGEISAGARVTNNYPLQFCHNVLKEINTFNFKHWTTSTSLIYRWFLCISYQTINNISSKVNAYLSTTNQNTNHH